MRKPFEHQLTAFELSKDRAAFALLMEQGTGKSKVIADTAQHLYLKGAIDAVLVFCPKSVSEQWRDSTFRVEFPDELDARYHVGRAYGTQWREQSFAFVLKHKGLAVYIVNYETVILKEGLRSIKRFLVARKVLWVCDESYEISSPTARRTKRVRSMKHMAPYRRILDGTPVSENPFDFYAPFDFLDSSILDAHSYTAFKSYHGEYRERRFGHRTFPELVGFRHLDELMSKVDKAAYRKLKKDCLDLPEKTHDNIYYSATKLQIQVHDRLAKMLVEELASLGVKAPEMAAQRALRQQQALCNYAVDDEDNVLRKLGKEDPRMDATMDFLGHRRGKAVIWARFRQNVQDLKDAIAKEHGPQSVVTYDGSVSNAERLAGKQRFLESKETRFFVGNPAAGGVGLDLQVAGTVIYYSHDYRYRIRAQSEDRTHRIGMGESCDYFDVVCPGTIDERIILIREKKQDLAEILLGMLKAGKL